MYWIYCLDTIQIYSVNRYRYFNSSINSPKW